MLYMSKNGANRAMQTNQAIICRNVPDILIALQIIIYEKKSLVAIKRQGIGELLLLPLLLLFDYGKFVFIFGEYHGAGNDFGFLAPV